jgi:hypothetical protein
VIIFKNMEENYWNQDDINFDECPRSYKGL